MYKVYDEAGNILASPGYRKIKGGILLTRTSLFKEWNYWAPGTWAFVDYEESA